MIELVIVKLGGAVITKKSEEKKEVNREILKRLAREISEAKRSKNFKLILVHGAGPFGHVPAKKYALDKGLKEGKQVEGMAITHQSMEQLNFQVVEYLQEAGLNAIAFQPSAAGILEDEKLVSFSIETLNELLALDLVPVLYGDVLIDKKRGIGILSGDHLVSYLAEKMKAKRVIFCADVDGLFTADPKKNKNAKLIREFRKESLKQIEQLGGSQNTDVTGGMKRKITELLDIAEKGIRSEIINGLKPGLLKMALLCEKVLGTTIK